MLLGIHADLLMHAVTDIPEIDQAAVAAFASKFAVARSRNGDGRGVAHMVRIPKPILSLLESAKPVDQPMVEFLKEAALTVALQRLEASQN